MIAIAMGEAGVVTRILGPSRGAFLTYGALDAEHTTAPGQISASDLRDVYRVHALTPNTAVVGIVGSPVGHSISPQIHNAAFDALDLDAVYLPFEVHDLDGFIRRMVNPRTREIQWPLLGFSVTAPHKSAVMEYLEWCDPVAEAIGAVNTVAIEGDVLRGYNTDAAAFVKPLIERGTKLSNSNCAIIGAGGAARSAAWSLKNQGARVTLFVRDVEKGSRVADSFDVECAQLAGAAFDGFDLVVNATTLGTRGQYENETPVSVDALRGTRIAYDLVYNPTDTRFLREARAAGCETIGGLSMLVEQAVEQFRIWMKQDAPIEVMRRAATGSGG